MSPNAPSVPLIPARNLVSQPSGEGQIEEIIKPSPDHDIEDLQPSQEPIIGPGDQAQPRRSERIHLQQDKTLPSKPVTRSQTRKSAEEYCSILAYENNKDNYLETSEIIQDQDKEEFDEYFTTSAHAESVEKQNMENTFMAQDLIAPANTTEALKDPIWRKSIDDEYEALIKKKVWEVVLPPPNTNIVKSCWTHICKCNEDRTAKAKSRVVTQGFTQTFGVNYDETYAPVSRLASLQTICTIAARNDLLIH